MYIQDLKSGFYDLLIGKRVIIFVNYDVDAICAFKILHDLLKYDEILYTMVPVQGVSDLKREFEETPNENVVILINCGGSIDIVDELQPHPDVVFFVVDSHRPTDVCNIYSQSQVRLLRKVEDDENVPDFDDIFRDDEGESEDSANSSGSEGDEEEGRHEKRARKTEEAIMKRRDKRLWEEKRNRIVFEYSQFSYYGRSSSAIMFELAWKLTKDNLEILWWAVVGVTEQLVLDKIESHQFILEAGALQTHMLRLSHQLDPEDPGSIFKVTFEKDLQLSLYRHWSVESSLFNTRFTACKLKIWSLNGERRLQQLLADMGIPLAQSKQKFCAMDLQLRQEFCEKMESQAEKYGLDGVGCESFTLQYGYRQRYSASDVIYSLVTLLESTEPGKTPKVNFMDTLDALTRAKCKLLDEGIERSKDLLTHMFQFVRNTITMGLIHSAGPFLFLTVQEGLIDYNQLLKPHCLGMLTRFVLEAYVASSKSRRSASQPLIISAPYMEGIRLLLGIPPIKEESPRNFFGKAFENAAEKSQIEAYSDLFDTSYILIKAEDQERFFDALIDVLK
ncbi:cell division control protein 45 homolog [Neocloeon triangulifer]|uniref:cell division control protein 45 homolog n=1 Tax=Neocloeon triangulifer TaxID=2078957 RepID=UPI00286EFCC7|nr:cell division control protein 45 homolog [Neocloeon triangulifer]